MPPSTATFRSGCSSRPLRRSAPRSVRRRSARSRSCNASRSGTLRRRRTRVPRDRRAVRLAGKPPRPSRTCGGRPFARIDRHAAPRGTERHTVRMRGPRRDPVRNPPRCRHPPRIRPRRPLSHHRRRPWRRRRHHLPLRRFARRSVLARGRATRTTSTPGRDGVARRRTPGSREEARVRTGGPPRTVTPAAMRARERATSTATGTATATEMATGTATAISG